MLLHKPMLYRYCDLIEPLSKRKLKATAQRITDDFLRMCPAL